MSVLEIMAENQSSRSWWDVLTCYPWFFRVWMLKLASTSSSAHVSQKIATNIFTTIYAVVTATIWATIVYVYFIHWSNREKDRYTCKFLKQVANLLLSCWSWYWQITLQMTNFQDVHGENKTMWRKCRRYLVIYSIFQQRSEILNIGFCNQML